MSNLIAFINMFLSYFLVFAIFAACIFAAVFVGIKLRKSKNLKEETVRKEETMEG